MTPTQQQALTFALRKWDANFPRNDTTAVAAVFLAGYALGAQERQAQDATELDRLTAEVAGLKAERAELLAALGDLSFACFGGIGTRAPDVDTYNRTFGVFDKYRAALAAQEPTGGARVCSAACSESNQDR